MMYFLLVSTISLAIFTSCETAKPSSDPSAHPAVGATYQAIIKRHYRGAASSSTTAEILNTVTSPHSSASVSFTTTSVDHPSGEPLAPTHGEGYPLEHAKPYPFGEPKPYLGELPKAYALPEQPKLYPVEVPKPYALGEHLKSLPPPAQHYDTNHIVNDQDHAVHHNQLPTYGVRFSPNQTAVFAGYAPVPRASPKAFSYQPVITLANNIKSFYKLNQYAPFVVPPNQYYADNYLSNLLYPAPAQDPELPQVYKTYPPGAYPDTPSPVLPYNLSAYPTYDSTPVPPAYLSYNTPTPHAPLSLPPPEGLSLVQGVSKPYKDNAYLEPERSLFRPVLVYKKYST
ncbi:hypothetical protein M8J76_010915 [Diaphorina citri]|nr:hypothetical protein M8J76_010915 [Diaphorina citri]